MKINIIIALLLTSKASKLTQYPHIVHHIHHHPDGPSIVHNTPSTLKLIHDTASPGEVHHYTTAN